jgi:hypothetical protein
MSNNDYDFGFSLMSEEEIKENEKLLETAVITESAKLEAFKNMIMPFLNNLTKNPEKEYIYWPDRAEKVKQFINKIETFLGSE